MAAVCSRSDSAAATAAAAGTDEEDPAGEEEEDEEVEGEAELAAVASPPAVQDPDVAARAATAVHGRTGQGGELHTVGPLSFLQRLTEAFGAHWFDEIANRADLEGFQSKFIMGGTENHGWRRLALT